MPNLLEQLVDRYRAIVRVFRDDNGLKVEPHFGSIFENDKTIKLYISRTIDMRGFRGDERALRRVGLMLTEDEARWLVAQLNSILDSEQSPS